MTGKYSKADLHWDDSEYSQIKSRYIFDDLMRIGKAGGELSEIEKNFLYIAVKLSQLDDGQVTDYVFLDDTHYKYTYLTYFYDLTGGSSYFKIYNGKKLEVPRMEVERDLAYIISRADEWWLMIKPGGHKESLLQEVAVECKFWLKRLERENGIGTNPFIAGSFFYEYQRWKLLARTKYHYIVGKEIWQNADPATFRYLFCGEEIEFTERSLIHILSRHFSEVSLPLNSGKTFHTEDMVPRILTAQLKEIIEAIDSTGLFTREVQTKLSFVYKNEPYQFWANTHKRSIPGVRGEQVFKRVETYYRVSDETILKDLHFNYKPVVVDSALTVFVPK